MAQAGFDALGLDWTVDARLARSRVGGRVALQGNLDPSVLLAPPEAARCEVRRVLDAFGPAPGHVFNLGHGIMPAANPETVGAVLDEVRAYSRKMRG
jgi:uroporphyrinogen decarboxylase